MLSSFPKSSTSCQFLQFEIVSKENTTPTLNQIQAKKASNSANFEVITNNQNSLQKRKSSVNKLNPKTLNSTEKTIVSTGKENKKTIRNLGNQQSKLNTDNLVQYKRKNKTQKFKQRFAVAGTNENIATTKKSNIITENKIGSAPDYNENITEKESVTIIENKINAVTTKTDNLTSIIENKKSESIAGLAKNENPLEEILLTKESEKKKTIPKTNKWQITSNVAPVFINSSSKESPIDPALNQYNKTFETNLSLGIGLGYAISKKITIRSGVNRFTMAYATNDIFFRAGLGNPAMQNMTSANNGAGLELVSRPAAVDIASANEISPQVISEGSITQKMGYFEIPLEMSYAVVNKKFGIDVIGGISTLFLTENEITMQSGAMTSTLGKASNLRDIHFSSNIGIGFRYRFWKSFQARLEPTLKYQLNTFTDNATGFKPYFIAVYSGISFGF